MAARNVHSTYLFVAELLEMYLQCRIHPNAESLGETIYKQIMLAKLMAQCT